MRLVLPTRATAALAAAATLSATLLVAASPAKAGPPAIWARLTTSHGLSSLTGARLVRFHGNLQVFWTQHDADGSNCVQVRALSAAGKPNLATHPVISGWAALIDEPSPIIENGQPLRASATSAAAARTRSTPGRWRSRRRRSTRSACTAASTRAFPRRRRTAQPYQQIAMASRVGGGVYIAYTLGIPRQPRCGWSRLDRLPTRTSTPPARSTWPWPAALAGASGWPGG